MGHRSNFEHCNAGRKRGAAAGLLAAVTTALVCGAPAFAQPIIQPTGPAWTVQPKFEKNADARKAISGAACAPTSPPVCLAANDEKKYAQFFSIKDKALAPAELIRLVPDKENGIEFDELDAEGVAHDGGFFYVIGSHGAPRKAGKPIDPSRFFIFRFKVNEQSGKPDFKFSDDFVDTTAIEKRSTLREVIKTAPNIAPFAEKPLNDENGANIEGIAVKEGRIFLGFRGPSVAGKAFILTVDANGVFGSGSMNPTVHSVALGDKVGIRDLAALKTGMLILSGPAGDTAGAYAISHWDEKSGASKSLAVLGGVPAGGKPETLIVLDEGDPQHYRVLVLIEGIENANPLEYRVQR
jgi:Protein of unknown function (DUF3616)